MTNERALEIITDPRGGPEPDSPEHREFITFLGRSPEYRRMYERQRAVWESLDAWDDIEPSAGFDRALRAKIDQAARPWPQSWFAEFRPSFAAGLAALVIAAWAIVGQRPAAEPDKQAAADGNGAYAQQIEIALDDLEMLAEFDVLPL